MGCSSSKAVEPTTPGGPNLAQTKKPVQAINNPVVNLQQQIELESSRSLQRSMVTMHPDSVIKQEGWTVRPGYSSGASSYAGSDDEAEDDSFFELPKNINHQKPKLESLRKEIQADGELTKLMVRIETPFDTPVEEIYDGVFDGPVLGSGVSGVVRRVKHRTTGVMYAVKCLDLGLIDTPEGLRQLRDEIFIMCQLDHPNIVRIEEVYESSNEIYIIQELCLGGDLFDRLNEEPDYHYSEAQCAHLVKQMLSSVRYLHSKGIIHRDLKLENFLFSTSSPTSELRMIDFGLSKHFEIGECHVEKVGTPYTVAPEIIRGTYDEKSDIWSLGVITYLLLSGETPFGGLDGESLLSVKESILRAKVDFEPVDVWGQVSDSGKAFVKSLLNPNPIKRPTAKEAQRSSWIQVWAKKDASTGSKLNPKTVGALIHFKESSDMQKLLSEVLSFTLLPEQIVELRKEFEIIDADGDGEITLSALKNVLAQNAEVGALGALTEQEVEDIFSSMRVRKTEPTIRWHEFLAAGLSQARVDDRNLRLAFDRLDTQRRGFLTFEDLSEVLGGSTGYEALERIWMDSLEECKAHVDRITFEGFKKLMKGQPKELPKEVPSTSAHFTPVSGKKQKPSLPTVKSGTDLQAMDEIPTYDDLTRSPASFIRKRRSLSLEHRPAWDEREEKLESSTTPPQGQVLNTIIPCVPSGQIDPNAPPLVANRALYRKHREMRMQILEASKRFDSKRQERKSATGAGLIMKRGTLPPAAIEDAHTKELFEDAAKRCGRIRRARNKTVSDVTGMMLKHHS